MAQQNPPSASAGDTPSETPQGDPWHAFGYIVAGVLVYGGLGWALDHWWGTSWLVVVGILVGATLGTYLTWVRFNKPWSEKPANAQQHPKR